MEAGSLKSGHPLPEPECSHLFLPNGTKRLLNAALELVPLLFQLSWVENRAKTCLLTIPLSGQVA